MDDYMSNSDKVAGGAILGLMALAFAFIATACEPNMPSQAQAKKDVDNIVFQRHANGLCFAVVRFTTYAGYEGTSISLVPSEHCR